jgi:hypothetical protein
VNIYQRLNLVMKDVRGVAKDRENRHQGYKYQGHADVTEAVRDSYVRHGIVRSASIDSLELNSQQTCIVRGVVRWTSIEDLSYHEVSMWAAVPATGRDKQGNLMPSATQSGVALSYLTKQAELKTLSLTDDDTPDAGSEDITRGIEQARERPAVDVEALLNLLHDAKTKDELAKARAAVQKAGPQLNEKAKQVLTAARDAAIKRVEGEWTDGAPQGRT